MNFNDVADFRAVRHLGSFDLRYDVPTCRRSLRILVTSIAIPNMPTGAELRLKIIPLKRNTCSILSLV